MSSNTSRWQACLTTSGPSKADSNGAPYRRELARHAQANYLHRMESLTFQLNRLMITGSGMTLHKVALLNFTNWVLRPSGSLPLLSGYERNCRAHIASPSPDHK